jgi:hypothetical protein
MEMEERDLPGFVFGASLTVRYTPDEMRCDVFYNGWPTAIFAARDNYDAPFGLYIKGRPTPVLIETDGWGIVGGISMILDALIDAAELTPQAAPQDAR